MNAADLKTRNMHMDSFAWRAEQTPFGVWVNDVTKFEKIEMEEPDFDKKLFARQMRILEDTRLLKSDLAPVLGVTNYGIAVVPSVFGATLRASGADVDRIEEMGYWIEPLVRSAEDIAALEEPQIQSALLDDIMKHMTYYREHKPEDVWISNSLDGPFSIAELLRGPDLYVDLYEDPEMVHRLMELCTAVCIKCEKKLRALLGHETEHVEWFPTYFGVCMPGLRFGDDSIVNLSEDMIRTFVLPCYERIAQSFGCKLLIHFCSVHNPIGEQIVRALADSDAIVGISSQLGYELYDEFEDVIRGRLAIECGYGTGVEYAAQKYGSFAAFASRFKKKAGMIFYTSVGSVEEGRRLMDAWHNAPVLE